jgi:hypothetical protein
MDKMWKGQAKNRTINTERGKIFRDGRHAMFIHWGLFSQLVNKWRECLSNAISSYLSSNYYTMNFGVSGTTLLKKVGVPKINRDAIVGFCFYILLVMRP